MKSFSERNPLIIGAIGIGLLVVAVVVSLQYDKLPFYPKGKTYSAYFSRGRRYRTGYRRAGVRRQGRQGDRRRA